MTEEKIKLLDDLYRIGLLMRKAQQNYFKICRSNGTMEQVRKNAMFESKKWEAKFDQLLTEIEQLPQQKFFT